MLNPILKHRNYTLVYAIAWGVVITFQALLSILFYSNEPEISIASSLVFNSLYAIIGIGIWYPVYYTDLEKNRIFNFLTNHLASSSLAVGIWLWMGYMILIAIFPDNLAFIESLDNSIPTRVGIGFLIYILLTLNYYLIIYYQNFKDKLTRESELKALVKESELSSLKSQINPHFLFNSLNSISSLTMISPEKAQEMVVNLSEFLRYSLSNKKETLTSFDEELKNLDRYLLIEKIRFGKRLNVKQHINNDSLSLLLPGLILQPIIENAVKYGIYESIDESDISISSRIVNKDLEVQVYNDYDPDFLVKKGAGIGIKNVMSRLKILYGRDDLIHIDKSNNIFKITLLFPQGIVMH